MSRNILSALIAPALLLCGAAAAADLPRHSAPPQDYYAPPPAFVWQGFYFGVNGGYAFSAFQDGSGDLLGQPSGWLIGATGGYNHTFAPNFLVGVEGDFDFSDSSSGRSPVFGLSGKSAVDNILTVRGRAGVTLDRILLFVTGGFAASNNTATLGNGFTGFYGQQSKFQPGWALGGGIELGVAPNLSAKAEYIFTSVGGERYFDFSPNALQSNVDTSMVRGGLNYHF